MIGQLAKNRPRFRSAYEILGLEAALEQFAAIAEDLKR
jgi:hypothetical protein